MSYHEMLRAVGQWIDEHPHESFRVLEGPAGFSILLQTGPTTSEHHLAYQELEQMSQEMQARRREPVETMEDTVPGGYRDVLRALGTRLDQEKAALVMVDEVEDELLVTYSAVDSLRGFAWRKHHFTLGPADMREMVKEASAKRKPTLFKKKWWRL